MKCAGASLKGKKRNHNQDRFLIKQAAPETVLLAVADGLGGQPSGHVASQTAVDGIRTFQPDDRLTEQGLSGLLTDLDRHVESLSKTDPELTYMGTTLTLAFVRDTTVYWAHAGDTRLYHLTSDILIQRTTDQTMAQFLVDEGDITKEEALVHPMQNLLDQSIGTGDCEPETGSFPLSPGDMVLLCSDGVYSKLTTKEIKMQLVSGRSLQEKVDLLIETARASGSEDDITAVVMAYCP
jgi:protein phosphatase